MNIRQAIEHVADLKGRIETLDKAIAREPFTGYGRPIRLDVKVFVEDVGTIPVLQTREQCVQMLIATRDAYRAEITQIQPVIDMANAALKGVLS
ncbi:hypothetical protein RE432_15010 [Pusillimonas sp. SM2304]|uniref:hypothetical protein n=1 Tax=Pusillimonas sp. SM2304 TaxID=3073241 RepID=UPI002874700D|nr:hypothetical protein [Pusillimonas sp. SM2304]MDS1141749.1 hypothetical protein [Pusillimonas sp. SM2304]